MTIFTTSWDDGTPEDLELARLLNRYGFRGTFYATTGPGGRRTIDNAGLEALVALGHEIGNHGRTHRRFVELTKDELIDEVDWGEAEIERFMQPPRVIAPPLGSINRSVISALNARGLMVRAAPILGSNRPSGGVLMPTVQLYPHTVLRTYGHLLRRRSMPAASLLKAWSRSRTLRRRLSETLRAASLRLPVVHLWGHSREVDRLGLWPDLGHILEHAADLELHPSTNGEVARSSLSSQ